MTMPPPQMTPKKAAQVLTPEGFIRWTEGKKLRPQDVKAIQ